MALLQEAYDRGVGASLGSRTRLEGLRLCFLGFPETSEKNERGNGPRMMVAAYIPPTAPDWLGLYIFSLVLRGSTRRICYRIKFTDLDRPPEPGSVYCFKFTCPIRRVRGQVVSGRFHIYEYGVYQ
jgi:hypothetical protein